MSHELDSEPIFSCVPNPHSHLPVYTNIHRIRRDVISIVEDYMSLEQLRDVRINVSVIRPLVCMPSRPLTSPQGSQLMPRCG